MHLAMNPDRRSEAAQEPFVSKAIETNARATIALQPHGLAALVAPHLVLASDSHVPEGQPVPHSSSSSQIGAACGQSALVRQLTHLPLRT